MKNNIITEFINGQSCRAYEALGAVKIENGIRFSTYAPHARKVELCLNGDIIPMECDERGVWSVERPAKEGGQQLPFCAQLQLSPHPSGRTGHPAPGYQRHAA